MDAIFINSENSKTSAYHALVLKLAHELDLKRGQKSVALSNLSIYYTRRNIKCSYNNNIFNLLHSESVDNPTNKIYVNKIKRGLHLKLKMDIILNF